MLNFYSVVLKVPWLLIALFTFKELDKKIQVTLFSCNCHALCIHFLERKNIFYYRLASKQPNTNKYYEFFTELRLEKLIFPVETVVQSSTLRFDF